MLWRGVVEARIHTAIIEHWIRKLRAIAHVGWDVALRYATSVRPGVDVVLGLP